MIQYGMLSEYDRKKLQRLRIKSIIMMLVLLYAFWQHAMIAIILQLPVMAILCLLTLALAFAIFTLIYSWIKLK